MSYPVNFTLATGVDIPEEMVSELDRLCDEWAVAQRAFEAKIGDVERHVQENFPYKVGTRWMHYKREMVEIIDVTWGYIPRGVLNKTNGHYVPSIKAKKVKDNGELYTAKISVHYTDLHRGEIHIEREKETL